MAFKKSKTVLLIASLVVRLCKLDHIGRKKSEQIIVEKSKAEGQTNQAFL